MTAQPPCQPTGNAAVDRVIRGLVGIFETLFPQRIRGVYLFGSHSAGSAQGASDVDIGIIFKDTYATSGEPATALRLCNDCKSLSLLPLDMWVQSEAQLADMRSIGHMLQLRNASTIVYGDDIRQQIPEPPHALQRAWTVHAPAYGVARLRPGRPYLQFPLDFPDPDGDFYGYDQLVVPVAGRGEAHSSKLLVATVLRIASAIIALRTGKVVVNKADAVRVYRAEVQDIWAELIERVHLHCRNQWGYLLPENTDDLLLLRSLCEQALQFENHYLNIYRTVLLYELQQPIVEMQLHAAQQLGAIIYQDTAVYAALQGLMDHPDDRLRHLIARVVQTMTRAASQEYSPAPDSGWSTAIADGQ